MTIDCKKNQHIFTFHIKIMYKQCFQAPTIVSSWIDRQLGATAPYFLPAIQRPVFTATSRTCSTTPLDRVTSTHALLPTTAPAQSSSRSAHATTNQPISAATPTPTPSATNAPLASAAPSERAASHQSTAITGQHWCRCRRQSKQSAATPAIAFPCQRAYRGHQGQLASVQFERRQCVDGTEYGRRFDRWWTAVSSEPERGQAGAAVDA